MSEHRSIFRAGEVTAVVTSCGRYDLLQRTLDSFLGLNTCPLAAMIVVEDGPGIPTDVRRRYSGHHVQWLSTVSRVGQIAAIDYAYRQVSTEYVFHLEDDWEFYRPGFIERSMTLLAHDRNCLVVWLRALNDTVGHPVEADEHTTGGVSWRRLALDYDMNGVLWHGFTFNPGLRRLSDYGAIGSYGLHARFDFNVPWTAEQAIGSLYRSMGFHAAILADWNDGYVRHIGRARRVPPPADGGSPLKS